MNLTPQACSQQNAVKVALVITRKDNRAALRDIFPASHLRMKEEAEQRPDEHIKEPVKKHHESPTFIFSFFKLTICINIHTANKLVLFINFIYKLFIIWPKDVKKYTKTLNFLLTSKNICCYNLNVRRQAIVLLREKGGHRTC